MALFESLRLGHLDLKHRIAMSAMTRLRNDPMTEAPRELNAVYYTQRSSDGGLLVAEGTHPCPMGRGDIRPPGIWTEAHIEGWKKVTSAVHERGAFIFCQLMHTGRVSHPSLLPDNKTPIAPSAVPMQGLVHVQDGKAPYVTPREITTEEIPSIVQDFVEAAKKSIEAGFDGIELHAGNGYLLQQFLAEKTNLRTDGYGDSVQNRCRFLLETIDACCSAIGKERVAVKLQCGITFSDLIESEEDSFAQLRYLGPELSRRQLAYTCLSRFFKLWPILGHELRSACSLNYAPWFYQLAGLDQPHFKEDVWRFFRQHYKGLLMMNGAITPAQAEEYVREGIADCVAFATLYLANANLPHLIQNGKELNNGGADPSTWYGRKPEDDALNYTDWSLVV